MHLPEAGQADGGCPYERLADGGFEGGKPPGASCRRAGSGQLPEPDSPRRQPRCIQTVSPGSEAITRTALVRHMLGGRHTGRQGCATRRRPLPDRVHARSTRGMMTPALSARKVERWVRGSSRRGESGSKSPDSTAATDSPEHPGHPACRPCLFLAQG